MKIRNWERFQHFKNRRPPWIKLYRDLLDDPEFHALSGGSVKTLIMLWLIASEDKDGDGVLPDTNKLAFRLRMGEDELKQLLSTLQNWVISSCHQDDVILSSRRYQVDTPEGETEGEKEKEVSPPDGANLLKELDPITADIQKHFGSKFNPYAFMTKNTNKHRRPVEVWIDLFTKMLGEKDNINDPWGWATKVLAVEAGNTEARMYEGERVRGFTNPGEILKGLMGGNS